MRFTTKLLPSKSGHMGILTLNHPQALHALTSDMIHCFQDVIEEYSKDPTLKAILLKASGAKRPAFCAGGDVKAVYQEGLTSNDLDAASKFFWDEYQVNHALATSKIPIVSLWDGVVMGGGVGISIHGKYRVATEQTLFAMPETAIGLFPDVGSMWWMPRMLKPTMARYLALSGQRIHAADLLQLGLATHYVPSQELAALESALVEATISEGSSSSSSDGDVVASVLMSFHEPISTGDCFIKQHQAEIDANFAPESVEGILEQLKKDNSSFGQALLEKLLKMSPTSLKVTLEGLKRGGAAPSIGDDLQMEYRMARACVRPGSDFYEGIRSVLVDKDHNPKWNPTTVEEVTEDMVESFFAPIQNEWPIPQSKL